MGRPSAVGGKLHTEASEVVTAVATVRVVDAEEKSTHRGEAIPAEFEIFRVSLLRTVRWTVCERLHSL